MTLDRLAPPRLYIGRRALVGRTRGPYSRQNADLDVGGVQCQGR